ncbi:MAG: hypothetical protein LC650_04780 [Actinobacteria bacterium]|nr:hypothetical protein [Actinomycetota bacterium]
MIASFMFGLGLIRAFSLVRRWRGARVNAMLTLACMNYYIAHAIYMFVTFVWMVLTAVVANMGALDEIAPWMWQYVTVVILFGVLLALVMFLMLTEHAIKKLRIGRGKEW